jgi:hypothetical protein
MAPEKAILDALPPIQWRRSESLTMFVGVPNARGKSVIVRVTMYIIEEMTMDFFVGATRLLRRFGI